MLQQLRNLCLVLSLSTALSGHLDERTLEAALPEGCASSAQEFCLVALIYRAKLFDQMELPSRDLPQVGSQAPAFQPAQFVAGKSFLGRQCFFSSAEICYLLMSLQR
jgi:hypothetical protein